ncbi:MAG: FecR domain-containing protein [Rhizobiaceae bacterium]
MGSALAVEQPVGSAIVIKQNVTGFGNDGARNLRVSDAVYRNEEISAASKSHGELELSDGSKIIVGENSVVLLDEFVVGEGGFKSGTIKVVKGAFRFVTGRSTKKGTFTVTTPRATIGVRGTFFDVYIGGGKETVVLFRGEVRVCSKSGCITARRSCDVIEIDPAGNVAKAPFFGSNRADSSERDYNLVSNQRRFTKPLRAPKVLCNARAAMESLNPAGNENLGGNDGFGPRGGGDVVGSTDNGKSGRDAYD